MAQTLGQVAVGTVVKINEYGPPINYIVVNQGLPSSMYDASCDGTWLLRQDITENRVWDYDNSNVLESSDVQLYLSTTWLNRYETDIRNAIKQVKIPYRKNGGNGGTDQKGANGLSCKIFLLSGYEVGWTQSDYQYLPVDGAKLSYFTSGASSAANNKRIAKLSGIATLWWLRSPYTESGNDVFNVSSDGSCNFSGSTRNIGLRPALVLPQNLYVWGDGTVSQYVGPAPSYITTPSLTMQGQPINVSWSSADDADSYILQRKSDSGEWTQVYAGTATSYTDTAGSWSTVQYQVCGVFGSTNGAFAQSEVITVLPASALVISGTDGDLGTITSDISYSVATDTGNPISLTLTVNGAQFFSGSVGTSYASNIPVMDLPTGIGTIVITATVQTSSDPVTATRTWTYTKVAQTFPGSGGVAQLTQNGQNVFPMTLAEAVKSIGGPWGGNLSTALNKLALAATYSETPIPKYAEVNVDLSTAKSGDIVNLPVNGVMVPHIVVQVGNPDPSMYDSSCNGVWLLRQDIVENGQWNSSGVNTLSGSTIMTTMQGYVTDYDPTVQAAIQTVKIPYCLGNGNLSIQTLSNGLECKIFPLSMKEVGLENSETPDDGVLLDYFIDGTTTSALSKRILNFNGNPNKYWSRSPRTDGNSIAWGINNSGNLESDRSNLSSGIAYVFLLPTTFTATYYVDESGNVYPSQEYTTAGDFYDLWGNVIPTVKIATGSYTGTGTYGQGNKNTLTFEFTPKFILILRTVLGGNLRFGYFFTQNGIFFSCQNGYSSTSPTASDSTSISTSGNSVSWYSTSAESQFNAVALYYYVAIG